MTYVMTKPYRICKKQLTKQEPPNTVYCTCENYIWPG
jgi:hypothetical protein